MRDSEKRNQSGKTLNARGLAGCQGAVLCWVDEHQAILAQVGDDGAARMPTALASVSVFEAGFVVWELKLDAPHTHGGGGRLTLFESCKIAQVPLRVGASGVAGELLGSVDFEHIAEVANGRAALVLGVFVAASKVVVLFIVTAPCTEDRKIADCIPKTGAWLSTRRVLEFRQEIPRQVVADADDELAMPFLRDPEFPGVLHLAMDAVAGAAMTTAQSVRLLLNGSEVCAPDGVTDAWDVFHYECPRLEEFHIAQELPVQVAARVVFNTLAMVGTVQLAGCGEPPARGAADDHIHGEPSEETSPDQFGELFRAEGGQVLVADEWNIREIAVECGNGLRVRVDCSGNGESRTLHAEAESPTATEQVNAGGFGDVAIHL